MIWRRPGGWSRDPAARRQVFPGYFRLYVEHALARGVVHTTPGRTAAALWIPAGADATGPPDGYDARLAAATSPWATASRRGQCRRRDVCGLIAVVSASLIVT